MAKDFSKANSLKVIKDVVKASNEKANVIQVKMINNENLFDFPKNHEDCENTTDLENAMRELGFTDPIEVTTFGMDEGKYTIISGHRRRVAGVKTGMNTFPCIIKSFENEHDIRNYVLLSNSQRDTSKDPLLFCKRYKMHEEYLKESGFKGSVREEIAKRLGISSQQADRYNQFNKVILPVWDMVRDEIVGMSNVLPMATHSTSEQEEILKILNECLEQGEKLTRETCDKIIKGYRDGKGNYKEIIKETEKPFMRDSGLPLNSFINTEPNETKDNSDRNRNDEVRREYDPTQYTDKDPYAEERLTQEDYETIEAVSKSHDNGEESYTDNLETSEDKTKTKKPPLSEEEQKVKRGVDIGKNLEALENCLNDFYTFKDSETAEVTMRTMLSVTRLMLEELSSISTDYDKENIFKDIISDLKRSIQQYE